MKIKIVAVAMVIAHVFFTGCQKDSSGTHTSAPAQEPSSVPGILEPAPSKQFDFQKQADITTKQLVAYSLNQSALEEKVTAPTPLAINSFILTTPVTEEVGYLYNNFMRHAQNGSYEYPTEKVRQIAYELFGQSDWILEGGDTKLDETKDAYVTGLEFGIGAFLYAKDVSSEITSDGTSVISKFHVFSDMASNGQDSPDPVTKDFGTYQITYNIMSEGDRSFLRFVALEKL